MTNNTLLVIVAGTSIVDPHEGDQIRTYKLSNELANRNWTIHVLEQGDPRFTETEFLVYKFARLTPDRLNDFNPALYFNLLRLIPIIEPDVIHVKTYSGVLASVLVTKVLGADTAVVYDAQNVQGALVAEGMDPELPLYKRVAGPIIVPYLESAAIRAANHVVAVSEQDKHTFMEMYDTEPQKITVIPSGVEIKPIQDGERRNDILSSYGLPTNNLIAVFHGSYNYYPNREAITQIETEIAPQVDDNIHFAIAGKGVPEADRGNITYVGFVDDLHEFLCATDIAVVPLLSGGGTKLKMFDYMNAGLPIVTTKKGAEGIALKDGRDAFVIESVNKEFIKTIELLLKNKERRKELGENARHLVQEKYKWKTIGEKLNSLYSNL